MTTIALHWGERMLRALAAGFRWLFGPACVADPRPPQRAVRIGSAPAGAPRMRAAVSDLSRRGPPSVMVAAG